MNAPFWKNSVDGYPWGDFDDEAKLDFSFDTSEWLRAAGAGITLAGAQIVDKDDRLLAPRVVVAGPLVLVRMENDVGVKRRFGDKMRFTLRMVASDGQQDDRTFSLIHRQR